MMHRSTIHFYQANTTPVYQSQERQVTCTGLANGLRCDIDAETRRPASPRYAVSRDDAVPANLLEHVIRPKSLCSTTTEAQDASANSRRNRGMFGKGHYRSCQRRLGVVTLYLDSRYQRIPFKSKSLLTVFHLPSARGHYVHLCRSGSAVRIQSHGIYSCDSQLPRFCCKQPNTDQFAKVVQSLDCLILNTMHL